jgi:hypothetical protein
VRVDTGTGPSEAGADGRGAGRTDGYETADLPPKDLPFRRLVGPGAILVGLAIGSGELILWPRLTAQYGPGMTWAAVLGVFLQLWINFEIGRYTIATGESVYAGFRRLSHLLGPLFFVLVIVTTILPAWAVASGFSLKVLLVGADGWGPPWAWTWITFAAILLLLLGPRFAYGAFERVESLLVLVITIGLVAVVARTADAGTWRSVLEGAANVGWMAPGARASEIFGALVFAGVGSTGNLFLSYYLRDKNIGMGARAPHVFNPLRGRTEALPCGGHLFPPTAENLERWRRWWRHFRAEQVLFFWVCNTVTILLFIVASAAILRPRGLVPSGFAIATTQASILGELMGRFGETLFLLVAFAALFSTQLGIIDGNARSLSDILCCGLPGTRRSLGWWYAVIVLAWVGMGAVLALFQFPPWAMFVTSSCLGGLAMAVYCPLLIVLNRRLPREIRPGPLSTAMLGLASAVYIAFTIYVVATL